ncbi:MAG: hypothetical protein GSR84_06105, partial [Desulfurococcales archaeon]|nr:hypothetical protein [Desulfurococcales archaeon]
PVLYTGGAGLTVYGDLWIVNPGGAPSMGDCSWVVVASDVIEVPAGIGVVESGLVVAGYRYGGEPVSPLMVLYVKSILYPIVASGGYPGNGRDVAFHTEAVVGVRMAQYIEGPGRYRVDMEVAALRTLALGGGYRGGLPGIPSINITAGTVSFKGEGCGWPGDGYSGGHIAVYTDLLSVEATSPYGPASPIGVTIILPIITTLGGLEATVTTAPTIVTVRSLSPTLLGGAANVMDWNGGTGGASLVSGGGLEGLPCASLSGMSVVMGYGSSTRYTHVVMGYRVSYAIDPPGQQGPLLGAVILNYYEPGNRWASDEDAMVLLLPFASP